MCARKGADPESAAADLEARETVSIGNAAISKASSQDPQAAPKFWRPAICPVTAIVVGERHRRDMGDLGPLAASMAELGLLHPIVVRPDGTLTAGERRLIAAESSALTLPLLRRRPLDRLERALNGHGLGQREILAAGVYLFSRYRHNDKWDCHGDEAPTPPASEMPDIPDFLLRRAAP